ncbi:MAG: serine/threonine-protein kinase [Planctomycetaceae bacterium]
MTDENTRVHQPKDDSATQRTPNSSQPLSSGSTELGATLIPPRSPFETAVPDSMKPMDPHATLDSTVPGTGNSANRFVRYFGDYELIDEIARGGMGVVYRARQVNLNRTVALKMILSGHLATETDIQRFRAEAEAAANLDHPGIVPIFEIGQHDGQHYFSMGFIDGQSLSQRVKDGPLEPKLAADLTRKIAEAIAYAHEKGVIHRDLKPANVLLDSVGEPRVTDFGLARRMESDSGLTKTGSVMGTPSYMPPEQAAGRTSEVGVLADVYSLGAMLYCLLTGRPPFQAATPAETMRQVMDQEPVSVVSLNSGIPRDLETICHKCLQKDPAKRYQGARELAEDLGRWQRGEPITARAVSTTERVIRWVRRNPIIAGLSTATVIAILIGSIVSVAFGIRAEAEAANARNAERKAQKSATDARVAKEKAEATKVRSDYFLAIARWNVGRIQKANQILQSIPRRYRNFEWWCTAKEFEGSAVSIQGHEGGVSSVCFSPDGTRIVSGSAANPIRGWVSGSEDKTIKLWDAATGKELKTFTGHESSITCVCFSPDGTRISSGSADGVIKLWNAATGEAIRSINAHKEEVTSASFSPNGDMILSSSQDATIKLWSTESGVVLKILRGHKDAVTSACFSHDGKYILSGSLDKTLKLWVSTTGEELKTLKGHEGAVTDVCFSPDGVLMMSACDDGCIKLWKLESGIELTSLTGHWGRTTAVSLSPDGTRILYGSRDDRLKLWDLRTGEEVVSLAGHLSKVTAVCFSPDGTRVLSGSYDNTIKLWDVAPGKQLESTEMGHRPATALASINKFGKEIVCLSPDGTIILSCVGGHSLIDFLPGSHEHTIQLWNTETGEKLKTLKGHESRITSACFSLDGKYILSGSYDHTIKLWNAETGDEIKTLEGHEGAVSGVCFSPDGTRILSGSSESGDSALKLWDAVSGQELKAFKVEGSLGDICFSPDGKRMLTSSGCINLWDAATGEKLKSLQSGGKAACFSPDGKFILSADYSHMTLWDVVTGEEIRRQEFLEDSGNTVFCFSPDGTRILSADHSHMTLWDAATGEELISREMSRLQGTRVFFSPDGTRAMYAARDGTLRSWDAATSGAVQKVKHAPQFVSLPVFGPNGEHLAVFCERWNSFRVWDMLNFNEYHEFRGHSDAITTVAFSSDSLQIASGSRDKTIRIWDVESGKVQKVLTGHADEVSSLVWFADKDRLASGSKDHSLRLWNAQSGEVLNVLKGHTDAVVCVVVQNEHTLISSAADKTIRLWNVLDGTERLKIPTSQDQIQQLIVSPDETLLAGVGTDRSIVIYDLTSGQERQKFTGHQDNILAVAFSQDGRFITSFDVKGVQLGWTIESGKALASSELFRIRWAYSSNPSVDGLIAIPDGKDVQLEDLRGRPFQDCELAFRKGFAAPKPRWHEEQAKQFEASENWFAATVHRANLMLAEPSNPEHHALLHDAFQKLKTSAGDDVTIPARVKAALELPQGKL